MRILHITVHMGGGVGRALSDLIIYDDDNDHNVILLQEPEKKEFIDRCRKYANILVCPTLDIIRLYAQDADIVIWHWWHHPIMCGFLANFPEIETRMILWSHVSGCTYPYLNPEFAKQFDYIIMTSKYTLENPYWTEIDLAVIRRKISLVYGQGKMEQVSCKSDYNLNTQRVNIGYVGTFAKSKMNPEFVSACKNIVKRYSNVVFTMVGDTEYAGWLNNEAEKNGINDIFDFTGYITDINEVLKKMDIFGYPLNPYNFATTENSILEAMAVGLPIVLLDQGTEKYIINHGEDGLLAQNMSDYVQCIVSLIEDKALREKLGQQASKTVLQKYSYKMNLKRFDTVIKNMKKSEKRMHSFKRIIGETPYEWFVSGVNKDDMRIINDGELFKLGDIFKENNKSSIKHFYSVYYNDKKLQELYEKLR